MTIPRNAKRQSNIAGCSPLEYFRRNVFLPLLDHVTSDLQNRFSSKATDGLLLHTIIPSILIGKSQKEIEAAIDTMSIKFSTLLGNGNPTTMKRKLTGELTLWKQKWTNKDQIPDTGFKAFLNCDADVFPTTRDMLTLLLTWPISVASGERSFSALKRLKTWLRTTISEERLVGLALLHVHHDIEISVSEIVNRFAKEKSRRLNLIL